MPTATPKFFFSRFFILFLLTLILAILISPAFIPRLRQLSSHLILLQRPLTTMASPSYASELQIAQLAVQRATILTKRVFHEKAKGTVDKNDKSPVTIGDFGAQALIIAALRHNFPDDAIVAEEEAAQLRDDANLKQTIWELVSSTKLDNEDAEKQLGGPIKDVDDMLELIDRGGSQGGSSGRIWAIDPIDGTKGFLRGGQYAVCLGLMVDGDVKVGVLGCPNLPVDDSARLTSDIGSNATDEGRGVVFSAVQGRGANSRPLTSGALAAEKPISMRSIDDLSKATFCESVEAGHSAHDDQALISKKLGITQESVRMDSQAKYGSIARGAGDIYLRLPVKATYQEKIWDHAAGDLIVREAGGQVTDIHGKRLDFSVGRTLANNKGVIAAPAAVHGKVLEAVQEVLSAKQS
ncbi:3'(2'),5'-bisphosphate nucleotidase [Fusarium oxysporum f. sp. lycopersici 4287]|uniref:3'(2'),5'-bisphosphate nucleotidase n=8 Tax=Fusarium oxysporum TaxID=5507 RepID=A0A0J9UXK7_FUSO4|nr:3'(2'),5'-bisphosphate nucleotidase [Fusarium oxysporum f. sp. lycopersici 4287]EXK35543.1 3'(2'),5'-bisphosphate nucleotidase [Fusarium oxysporum f. sp. melonis 26406]KAJ9423422.1 3',5'-bisphosphate nucleotidase [Fusarium oxysporum]KNB03905.1 3'(2'),5'-bisphosphate nucleotidase [Fusarium oxysporum f. sp. lycopersici 4287]